MFSPNGSPSREKEEPKGIPANSSNHLLLMERQQTEENSLDFSQKVDTGSKPHLINAFKLDP